MQDKSRIWNKLKEHGICSRSTFYRYANFKTPEAENEAEIIKRWVLG